jgi:PEGA domain
MRGSVLLLLTLLTMLLAGVGGCVRRTLAVKSDPPGAQLYLNGVEVGSTPLERDFTWYGTYDVVLRKEGYETLKTTGKVIAPWWQWVPIDLVAEFLPLHDRRHLSYTMQPISQAAVDPKQMLERAAQLQPQLQSSRYTRSPSTAPTTLPAR